MGARKERPLKSKVTDESDEDKEKAKAWRLKALERRKKCGTWQEVIRDTLKKLESEGAGSERECGFSFIPYRL